jgi:hypothetical protein
MTILRQEIKGTNDIDDAVVFEREMLGFSADTQQEMVLWVGSPEEYIAEGSSEMYTRKA